MPFSEKFFISLRLRILLALIAAGAAGIYLTYSAARRVVEPLAEEESGERSYSKLKTSAAAIDSEIASGLVRARTITARTGLREILQRRNRGEKTESDKEILRLRLKEAAKDAPGLTALTLTDAAGEAAGAFQEPGAEKISRETAGVSVNPDEGYVSPPLIEKGGLFYEVAVAVPHSGAGRGPAGTLRCRFTTAAGLRGGPLSFGEVPDFYLAKRRGRNLIITSKDKPRAEVGLNSQEAAPFLPALQGKEGYDMPRVKGEKVIYAYSRLPAADWLIAAQTRGPIAPLFYTTSILAKIRLQAWLSFVLLTIVAFLATNWLAAPLAENERLAAELLKECSAPETGTSGRCREAELVSQALTEAGTLIKQRADNGRRLQSEADSLREEEDELKYQNLELEKLNKYLIERETKISELKDEINELRGNITSGTTE